MECSLNKSSNEDVEPVKDPDVSNNLKTTSMAESLPHEAKNEKYPSDNKNSEYEESKENDKTNKFLQSKPSSSGFTNGSEGAKQTFNDYDSLEFTSEVLNKKVKQTKKLKKNSESEISGSESDSDSSKTCFMKSDSDTSMETVVDKKVETDFKDTENESSFTKKSKEDFMTVNTNDDTGTTFQVDTSQVSDNMLTPNEKSSSSDEALEMKTDCDSGFSSQVDMTHFTADVLTLRHEVPACDHKGTEPVTSTNQTYFSTNEGSIITFEYTMQDEIKGNFDKFDNTCIDLVRKDCPNKMAQLVYQTGLKALNENNRKHLYCVFMLDNDKGQIDKLFESTTNDPVMPIVFQPNQESHECSHSLNVENPVISNDAITNLLPNDNVMQEKNTLKDDIVSGTCNEIDEKIILLEKSLFEHIEKLNLIYKEFSSKVDIRNKDLSKDAIHVNASYQTEPTKKILSLNQIDQIKKDLDFFFQNKVTQDSIVNMEDPGNKCKFLQNINGNSSLNAISSEYTKATSVNDLDNELKEKPYQLNRSCKNVNSESALTDNTDFSKKYENKVIQEASDIQSICKTNCKTSYLNEPLYVNTEKNQQEVIITSNKMDINSKKNRNNTLFVKKYPYGEVIDDFSKLIIGSVEACSYNKKSKEISVNQDTENKNNDFKTNTQCDEKDKSNKSFLFPESMPQEKSTETKNPPQKETICQDIVDEKKSSNNEENTNVLLLETKSVHQDSSKPKANKLLQKALNEKFHTVNHILHVNENTTITKTVVAPSTQYQEIPAAITEVPEQSVKYTISPSAVKHNSNPETIDYFVLESSEPKNMLAKKLPSDNVQRSFIKPLEKRENSPIRISSILEYVPKEQRKMKIYPKSKVTTISLDETESSKVIISSVPECSPKVPQQEVQQKEKNIPEPEIVNKTVSTNNTNVKKNMPNLFSELGISEKMFTDLPKRKTKHRKRSSSCSKISAKVKVTFLSKNDQPESKYEGSSESWSEISDELSLVEETKPQFVRSAIHLLTSADLPYTPYKIVWIKNIIKCIDKVGILECNVDIPLKMRPRPVDYTTDTNIRPIIPRSNTYRAGLVPGSKQNSASASIAVPEDFGDPKIQNKDTQLSTKDNHISAPNSKKTYKLNADAAEYVPATYDPNELNMEGNPDIYVEFKPDIIKRPYRTVNPYDDTPQTTRLFPKQQIPFFPGGVYVARNGNVRLNLRSFISIDITVDLGIRVTYPFSKIILALSHNGKYAAMIHPCGRVYLYKDTIEVNIYDGYTGACKVAKMTERAVYFSNDITNKVYLVDKYGVHRNRIVSFIRLKEDFTPAILTQTGRHGPEYNDEAVRMLAGAKFETCGLNHIIIIKNIKIIQYPTGNLSIFRYDRKDHIQICPNEGHCKISTPNVHITGTLDITDNKPHIFVRKDDKRISFSSEKFFVRIQGQTAGYDAANEVFIDYPI